ncbi:MAG: CaiB/BaiF CoA transferase family protein [Pseudomonadota bacterium]
MDKLLEGIRILDFTHVHAGPLCTYQLALMGADVIKIESIDGGDQMRSMGTQLEPGISAGFLGQNASKRSLAIDLKAANGLSIVQKLTGTADVVVINMRPGTSERLGIDYDSLTAYRPDLVYCAISGYGQHGPESDRPAFDHLIQGESGMFLATGTETQPVRVGFAIADSGTAVIASSAICAALFRRQRTGKGAMLDVSMLESSVALMGLHYYNLLATGQVGPRVGPDPLAASGSAGTFLTADDQYLMVNANSFRLFERLAAALGRKDILENPKFSTPAAAHENRTQLRALLAGIFSTNTAAYWDSLLREGGVPAGYAKSGEAVLANAQFGHRKTLTELADVPGMENGLLRFLGAGFLVDEQPAVPSSPPPRLGEHTGEILGELGLGDEECRALQAKGVVLQG